MELPRHSVRAMKPAQLLVMCAFLALGVLGCTPVSGEDQTKLSELRTLYGSRYEFSLSGEFCLKTKMKTGVTLNDEELRNIYKMFFLNPAADSIRKTTFVYMNVYSPRGKFEYQLAYVSSSREFTKSMREFY